MDIQRINTYDDPRFLRKVLYQHGYFLVDGKPYEVEITSDNSAVAQGEDGAVFPKLIDEFRFLRRRLRFFGQFRRGN